MESRVAERYKKDFSSRASANCLSRERIPVADVDKGRPASYRIIADMPRGQVPEHDSDQMA